MRTKRIDLIERYIEEEKLVSLDVLCEKFAVSKNTIRRDIEELVKKGVVEKVYGGVSFKAPPSDTPLVPYEKRHTVLNTEKDNISKKAASFVKEGDIIYIDTGTTCLNMVDYLAHVPCTIITNSLRIFMKAVQYPDLQIISLPGRLNRDTLSTGVSIQNGLTNASADEYAIKKTVVENSQTRFLLSDHTKFGKFALMTYCPLSEIQYLITDTTPQQKYLDYCKEHEIIIEVTK